MPLPGTQVHGGLLVGTLLGSSLFGVATVQLALYSPRLQDDTRIVKFLILSPWVLQGVQIVFVSSLLCSYTVRGSVNPVGARYVPWIQATYEFAGVMTSALVQTFYAWRIYQLNRNLFLMLPLGILILSKLVTGSLVACLSFAKPTSFVALHIVLESKLWLISDAVLDIFIVLCLSFSLFRHRTGFRSTDAIINRLARYALHTGLVTSAVCTINLISFSRAGFTGVTVSLSLTTCSLYVVAMLANLHTRSELNRMFRVNETIPIQLSDFARESNGQTSGISGGLSSSSVGPGTVSGAAQLSGHDSQAVLLKSVDHLLT